MVESAKEVCGSVRVGGKNPKNVWWNDEVKAAVNRKEVAWKEVLIASNEDTKERCMVDYREGKKKVKGVYITAKRKYINSLEGR